jgi:hypothetical protein
VLLIAVSFGRKSWIFLGHVGERLDLALSFPKSDGRWSAPGSSIGNKGGQRDDHRKPRVGPAKAHDRAPPSSWRSPESTRPGNSPSEWAAMPHIQRKQQIFETDGILTRDIAAQLWLICVLK